MTELKVGDVLIAKKPFMISLKKSGLIIGKQYRVNEINNFFIVIKSEIHNNHLFDLDPRCIYYWGEYFKLKESSETDSNILDKHLKECFEVHGKHIPIEYRNYILRAIEEIKAK